MNKRTRHRIEDLEYARDSYVMVSRAFTPQNRRNALDLVSDLTKGAAATSNEEFLVGCLKIAAMARNGHDMVQFGEKAWIPPGKLPFRLIAFPDAWIVARAAARYKEFVGSRVVRIEELTPRQLLQSLAAVSGGIPRFRMWDAMWIVESSGLFHAMHLAAKPDRLRLTLSTKNGPSVTREVPFVPRSLVPQVQGPSRLWSREPFDIEEKHGWRNAAPQDPPLYLQGPDLPYRTVSLPALDAVYVQFRTNLDSLEYPLERFLEDTFTKLRVENPQSIVVDLRFNTGGNIELTREWLRKIPEISDQIYILVSRYTFSAGIVAAAALKHDARGHATVIGEPVGDRTRFWSEGNSVLMPHSNYWLRVTTGLWDLTHGCEGQPGCFGESYNATVDTLTPSIRAPLTAKSWIEGIDPMMSAVENHVSTR